MNFVFRTAERPCEAGVVEMIAGRAIKPELKHRYESEGWWTADTLGTMLSTALEASPDSSFRVYSSDAAVRGHVQRRRASSAAVGGGTSSAGGRPGDVVAFQLPNWMEAAATFWAVGPARRRRGSGRPLLRPKEVGYILTAAQPKVFITTEQFGRMRFQADLCVDVPIVALVGRISMNCLPTNPWRARSTPTRRNRR